MKLVIVESPSKAKTVAKYLGSGYIVDASGGHIRELPEKDLNVDVANNFEPHYEVISSKKDTVKRLKDKVAKCDEVYLATDPDREGEAISWHLQHVLGLPTDKKNRITFNEISKKAVEKSVQNPCYINKSLVDAQQARRVLDRLVGYKLSPVLCKKIQPKLSAGRVQSAALKLIVDREREILSFVPEEYWNITANLAKGKEKPTFKALLSLCDGKKLKVENSADCQTVLSEIEGKPYKVEQIKQSISTPMPQPPFTTSTMQQDAVTKLKFSSSKCMQIAQQLYEGIDVKGEHLAFVTYIRTDSVRIADDALEQARQFIASKYGPQYVPTKPHTFTSKKSAQDAHEAIRPINLNVTPEWAKDKISNDQYRLYKLIYDRFLASCAERAKNSNTTVIVSCDKYGFKATGKTVLFDGYTRLYNYAKAEGESEEEGKLPILAEGDVLSLLKLEHEQKFTKPPSRYTEAGLIKTMEENGIGRPSTFATIISTITNRKYVEKGKNFTPTELGYTVTEYMEKYFGNIVNIEFTSALESKLDTIEENEKVHWQNVVGDFYYPMIENIKVAMKSGAFAEKDDPVNPICSHCGSPMEIKVGKYGRFLKCTNPQCNDTNQIGKPNASAKQPDIVTDVVCEKCGAFMVQKEGRYGMFLACPNYPTCRNTKPLDEKPAKKVVGKCTRCGGDIVEKTTHRGKVFYGCDNYPQCNYASWDVPTNTPCPVCKGNLVKRKNSDEMYCPDRKCSYTDNKK